MKTTKWRLQLAPRSDNSHQPRFVQISRAIVRDIERGRLESGDRLPGSRVLARELGVHRNTVLAALDDLVSQGFLETHARRGTFVRAGLEPRIAAGTHRARAGFPLPPQPVLSTFDRTYDLAPKRLLELSAGTPDPRLFPVDLLARSWRRVLKRSGASTLGYGHPAGAPRLREALADMLRALRGLQVDREGVLVTRGSQMALELCVRGLLPPRATIAVEAMGYPPAWDAFRLNGHTLLPIPVDDEGVLVEALERVLRRRRVHAIYVTPHHQYPTTVTMSATRRAQLLRLARAHRVLVLEDDYDHEFQYEGRPVLPLGSIDDSGMVVSVGTLSKILAPGLRIGFVASTPDVIRRLTGLRAALDRQGDLAMESAVAEMIEEGELQRHVRTMREVYRGRRDRLAALLTEHLGAALEWNLPRGGISIWARCRDGIDADAWAEASRQRGVQVFTGTRYTFDQRPTHALRLVFSALNEKELERAVRGLRDAQP